MNKVVCNICGTSYPENVSECPICGFARSSDVSRENGESTYTYVHGGRFSKSNVRKRNKGTQKKGSKPVPVVKPSKKKEEKTSAGLVVVVILLLLAIIVVVGYIALRFFLPNEYIFEGMDKLGASTLFQNDETEPAETEPEVQEDEPQIDDTPIPEIEAVLCESIVLNQPQITSDTVGNTYQIIYQLSPVNTEEEVTFYSSDAMVATVDGQGLVTVQGEGTAVITVSCGSVSAQCEVICTLPTEAPTEETVTITLNRKEIAFTAEGESWLLYDGSVNVSEIVWTSDDSKVAAIENGKVSAVGNGDTTVYGSYDGQTVSCRIHCKFQEEDATESTGNVSEADGNSDYKTYGPYSLYNPHGYADDVTIAVGREFKLRLVDHYKNTVKNAQWNIEDKSICSYEDGVVKALAAGTTKITATFEGKDYTCIVRVNKN